MTLFTNTRRSAVAIALAGAAATATLAVADHVIARRTERQQPPEG